MKSVADDDDDTWVYDLTGSKAKGELTVVQTTGAGGNEAFHSAKLRLVDGTTVEIMIQPEADLIDQLKLQLDTVTPVEKTPDPETPPTSTEPVPAELAAPSAMPTTTPPEPSKPE